MKCLWCLQEIGSAGSINGICTACFYRPNESQYNYKCPQCSGEFIKPVEVLIPGSTKTTKHCPWCKRLMEGL